MSNRFALHLVRAVTVTALLLLPACSVVKVKVRDHSPAAQRGEVRRLDARSGHDAAARLLLEAETRGRSDEEKLSALTEAARLTADAAPGTPGRRIHEIATIGTVAIMRDRQFAPVVLPDGRRLGIEGASRRVLDPRTADELIPASDVQIRKLRRRIVQEGAGVPYVARFLPDSPRLRGQPGIPPLAGICDPVTAVWQFDRGGARLVFYRTRVSDTALVGGRNRRLAAAFSAPLAYMISKGRNRNIDIRALIKGASR